MTRIDPCPRCRRRNRGEARFCAGCGLSLASGVDGTCRPGRTRHPEPLAAPAGYERVSGAADLYYAQSSAWGGERLSPAENIGLTLFNAGYPLCRVELRISDAAGDGAWEDVCETAELPRGVPVQIELASWRMPEGVQRVRVALKDAEYSQPEENVRWDR